MTTTLLLDTYLRQLKLPTFARNYRKFAEDATQANQPYELYLFALAEFELAQRERNQQAQRIKSARFPVLKDLTTFDFACLPTLNKQLVLDLARGEYIKKVEPIIMVGNPGLGKTHLATALALAACRQGHKVRSRSATWPAWSTNSFKPKTNIGCPSSSTRPSSNT